MKRKQELPSDAGDAKSPTILGDSFGLSVLLLIGLTIAQRVIGLGRNILFCGLLEDHELGRWSIVNNFLGWAAPFVVLGLPGSFGPLAEHFRNKGQLRVYLRRTGLTCAILVAIATAIHMLFPSAIAKLAFNDPTQITTVRTMGVVLVAVILMNIMTEFLTSVRLTRAVSIVHLTNSLGFTVLGVLLVVVTAWPRELSLAVAFGLSAAAAACVGLAYVGRVWTTSPTLSNPEAPSEFWKKVISFAGWIWCGNTVANLFDVSDQFVLKHYSGLPATTIDAMVGQLYASRIIPGLIVTVAAMIGCSLLPYLIADWETGRRDLVHQRMNMVIKMAAIGFTLVAAATHLVSPLLFTWILRGKYDSGLHLMPLAFVQYTWFALVAIATKYLICANRAKLGTLPLFVGLVSGVLLIALLFPWWGLNGVVWATATGNALALVSLFVVTSICGMTWHRGTWIAALLPLSMCLGGTASLAITAFVILAGMRGEWFIHGDERQQLYLAARSVWDQVCLTWRTRQQAVS